MPFVFTASQALDRLSGGVVPAFKDGITDAQRLQRLNEALERFFEFGTWRGVHTVIEPACYAGLIALDAAYLRLDGLSVPVCAYKVPIKSMQWAFAPGGPGTMDWDEYCPLTAVDKGDIDGLRTYQLTGGIDEADDRVYRGLVRKRFEWITDLATAIVPDSFQALRMGVLALGFEDEADYERSTAMFNAALGVLNGNLDEFEQGNERGYMAIDPDFAFGRIANLV